MKHHNEIIVLSIRFLENSLSLYEGKKNLKFTITTYTYLYA